jgi:hypothetical protein
MSSLWTPSGEHIPGKGDDGPEKPPSAPRPGVAPAEAEDEETREQVEAMRRQLANTPAEVVVSNHCYGLFELAAIYLSQTPPMLFQARLAIDGLGYLLDGLRGRLGEAEPALFEALSQLRLAFVNLESSQQAAAQQAAASDNN